MSQSTSTTLTSTLSETYRLLENALQKPSENFVMERESALYDE